MKRRTHLALAGLIGAGLGFVIGHFAVFLFAAAIFGLFRRPGDPNVVWARIFVVVGLATFTFGGACIGTKFEREALDAEP